MSVTASLVGALVATAVLAALHLSAPHLRRLPLVPERRMASFAGGIAVSYVFLHLLPEIAAGNEAIGEALHDVIEPTPLLELAVFGVALTGFTVFYGLERLAARTAHEPAAGVYWVHLGAFMVYNGLITYTMALRIRTGLGFAVLFTVAMGLHFVLTDRGLSERYPRRFRHSGRLLLTGALVAGWVASVLLAPTSTLVVSLLTALLGGAVLLNVVKEEVPSERRGSFGWFAAGLVIYGVLLVAVTVLGGE